MPAAPIPSNEAQRLAALRRYSIMDTPAEEGFDAITRIAAKLCAVPVAAITLVEEDRQWFKSRVGLDVTETPRCIAFCAHALAETKPLMVFDARNDPRFADNPLVTGSPHLRFYAGVPLVTADGHVLGTLCVVDTVPRQLDGATLDGLQGLARQVMAQLELRETIQRLTGVLQEVDHRARHDALTGLPNRTAFNEQLAACITDNCSDYAVLYLDVDRFKAINDSLGHTVGDALLVAIAGVLREAVAMCLCRAKVARMAGDEFTILLEGGGAAAEAVEVARDIQRRLEGMPAIHGRELWVSASIGIAPGDGTYHRPDPLLSDADAAMYHAKLAGKGRHALFDASMRAATGLRLELEGGLRRALENRELLVEYQPIVSLRTGALVGFEALVRWRHRGRVVPPGEFIPLAEETGLILPIGRWVFEQACGQLAQWQRGTGNAALEMNINLSRRQLTDPELLPCIYHALAISGVTRGTVGLEITESLVMESADAPQRLAQIRAAGLRLYMDDFGTGYSSLACLQKFKLDGLKLDRSFLREATNRHDHAAVIHAVITLARNLGMAVVGEGLETAEHVALLQALDCDRGQGYLFSRPLAAEGMPELFARFAAVGARWQGEDVDELGFQTGSR